MVVFMSLKEQLQAKRELKARIEHEKQTIKDAQAKRRFIKDAIDNFTVCDVIYRTEIINSMPYVLIKNCQHIFNNQTEISLIEFYYISTQMFCLTFQSLIVDGIEYDTSETRRKIANLIIKHCTELHKLDDYAKLYDVGCSIVAKKIKITPEQQKVVNNAIVPIVQDDRELFLGFMELIEQDFMTNINSSKIEYSNKYLKMIGDMESALNNQYKVIKDVFKDLFIVEIDLYNKLLSDYDKINSLYNILIEYKKIDNYDIAIKFLTSCKELETNN